MGVLPLQFPPGESAASLGLTGEEVFDVETIDVESATEAKVSATRDGAGPVELTATVRLDTPNERSYFANGGILHRVLRDLRG
jgi:aconitate hydratase